MCKLALCSFVAAALLISLFVFPECGATLKPANTVRVAYLCGLASAKVGYSFLS